MKANRGFNLTVLVVSLSLVALIGSTAQANLVACVGDSNTRRVSDPKLSYPVQLATMLQAFDSEWQVRSFAVGGACVLQKGDVPYIRQGAYNEGRACSPDVVVIMLGTGDSRPANWVHKDDFLADFLTLIDGFVQLPSQPEIYVCYPPPAFASTYGVDNNVIRDEIIPLVGQLPTYRDVQVIDEYTPLKDSRHLFEGDGVHLNIEGAKLVARIVVGTIIGMCGTPDFNGDGIVNLKDFSRLAQYWGQSESQFDILPPPNGDGIVNSKDLAGFVKYWLQKFRLIAHWKLDETEGNLAQDIVADKDGTLHGEPVWEPAGGKINGALELDGVDDYVSTSFILDPSAIGGFSIFAWVKGGGPEQAIISQAGGVNWLIADTTEGKLMTELTIAGRFGRPLISQTIVTDGDWHRVGLTWDGSTRVLYVDDVEVAKDTQASLAGSTGGLYLGAGKGLEASSFWSGLIDDVRIYDRAVTP